MKYTKKNNICYIFSQTMNDIYIRINFRA